MNRGSASFTLLVFLQSAVALLQSLGKHFEMHSGENLSAIRTVLAPDFNLDP